MLIPQSPRRHAGRALLALFALASGVTANPVPIPCPPPVTPCAPCQSSVQPRIVVNVPPPEIVYQDAAPACQTQCLHPRWSLFKRQPCGQQPAMQTQTVMLTPMQTTATTFGANFGAANFGAANFGAANFGVANVQPTFVAQAQPTIIAQAQPTFVTQATGGQQIQATSGLAAIHQAELFAASVAANRAQQDAEMRVMMAALDRAKGSMAASAANNGSGQAGISSVGGAGCPELSCDAVKALIAATTANSKQIGVLAVKLDDLDRRLRDLTEAVDLLNQRQKIMLGDPSVMPPVRPLPKQ